ncbi:hypothetical protein PYW07_007215 [Mythimna separata]|uniref:Uncharacterized protein n=1 Tax=Mythimna separata TaxID=271217 RepID=A0AAD8E0E0_MYTSE|nr:hypothetical protein PYW07_007215 [Mythimna separata]
MAILYSILWFVILVGISFYVGFIAGWIYICILPFTVCIDACAGIADTLEPAVKFPKYCAEAMMDGRGF